RTWPRGRQAPITVAVAPIIKSAPVASRLCRTRECQKSTSPTNTTSATPNPITFHGCGSANSRISAMKKNTAPSLDRTEPDQRDLAGRPAGVHVVVRRGGGDPLPQAGALGVTDGRAPHRPPPVPEPDRRGRI